MSIPEHILEQIVEAIEDLPELSKHEIPPQAGDFCPICLTDFDVILSEQPTEEGYLPGVTKVEACNHVFCRQECVYSLSSS